MAEPCDKTINPPKSAVTMIIGTSQYFFRARIKSNSSLKKSIGISQNYCVIDELLSISLLRGIQ